MHTRSQISTLKWLLCLIVVGGIVFGLLPAAICLRSNQGASTSQKPVLLKKKAKKTLNLDVQPQLLQNVPPALLNGKHISPLNKRSGQDRNTLPQPRILLGIPQANSPEVKCLTDTCRYKQMLDKQTEFSLKPQDFLRQAPKIRFELKY
jgi:hypothetical protein